jgi:hypothetical protein
MLETLVADPLFPSADGVTQPFDPTRFIMGQQQVARAKAANALDDSPDDAARALELSDATGVPSSLIHTDLDNFEHNTRAAVTSELLRNNQFLANYANSHPLAASISNDDWGNLDAVSASIQKFGRSFGRVLEAGGKAATEAFGNEPLFTPFSPPPYTSPYNFATEALLERPAYAAGWLGGNLLRTFFMRAVPAATMDVAGLVGQTAAEFGVKAGPNIAETIAEASMDPALYESIAPALGPGAPVAEGIALFLRQMHERLRGAQKETTKPTKILGPPEAPEVDPKEQQKAFEGAARKIEEAVQSADPWLRAGVEPPVGVHPLIDQLHAERAKEDIKNLDEVMKNVQAALTFQRNPKLFRDNFLGQHPEMEGKIGVSSEGIEKLYPGDELPTPDDGKLGDIQGARAQVEAIKGSGGDFEAPIRDWVTIDPEVAKEVHDFTRVRPGGMTLEEAKEGEKPQALETEEKAPLAPFDSIKKSYGLHSWDEMHVGELAEGALQRVNLLPESAKPIKSIKYDNGRHTALWEFPVRDILDKIDPSFMTGVPRALFEFFGDRIRTSVGDVPIRIVPGVDTAHIRPKSGAYYDPNENHIVLPEAMIDGRTTLQRATHVIMEEASHAMTVLAIHKNPEIEGKIELIRAHALAKMDPEYAKIFRYALSDPYELVAWSQSHPGFQEALARTPLDPAIRAQLGFGENIKSVWEAVRQIVRDLITKLVGKPVSTSLLDAMFRVGEDIEKINKTQTTWNIKEGVKATPKDPFAGVTKPEQEKYRELIAKENVASMEAMRIQGEKEERLRQTAEWKENEAKVKEEVSKSLARRPDIATDRFLRQGDFFGQKVRRVRLDEAALSAEQKDKLDPEYYGPKGLDPQSVAQKFGYQTADLMIDRLSRLTQDRELQDLTPTAHFNQLRDVETQRLMQARYGDLEENILEAAKDHILGPSVMDRLHQEMVMLGQKATGGKFDITKQNVQLWARKYFNERKMGEFSSDDYLATSGRAGRDLEKSLLGDEPTEAFKFAQQRYINAEFARLARQVEKLRKGFEDKTVPPLLKRTTSLPAVHTNWIHDILSRTGFMIRRTQQDLQREIEAQDQTTLREWVQHKNSGRDIYSDDELSIPTGQQVPVADFLLDPNYRKPIDQMSVPEFKDYVNSIKAIAADGRNDNKVLVRGEKKDLNDLTAAMRAQAERAIGKKLLARPAGSTRDRLDKQIGALVLRPESWFNRLDLDNPRGIFNQSIVRPLIESENTLARMEREAGQRFRELWDFKPTGKAVENRLFKDPGTDEFMAMNDTNVAAVLANVGNAHQHRKLSMGYNIPINPDHVQARVNYGYRMWMRDPVMEWLFKNTTKEDWDRQQRLGDFFNHYFEESARMYRRINDVAPERIELTSIETRWGDYKGWYHPLIPDPIRAKKLGVRPEDLLEETGYYRPAPASGYTKARTGAVYPILLDFSAIPFKIKTMLNDIALREAVTDVAKIFYHPEFKDLFIRNLGKEYYGELIPWLRDIVGKRSYQTPAQRGLTQIVEFARQNLINQMIGLNPGTVMKHAPTAAILSMREVGVANFANAFKDIFAHNPETGDRWWSFAMKTSEELQRRSRNWQETMTGAQLQYFQPNTTFNTVRDTMRWLGAQPVAFSDALSAVPTWIAKYREAIAEGATHGDAVFGADRAVRRAHGSTAIAARPNVMRQGPLAHYFLPFYNFFNTILNAQYEAAWKAKLVLEKRGSEGKAIPDLHGQIDLRPDEWESDRSKEYKAGLGKLPHIAGMLFAAAIAPAIVEELVDPEPLKPKESWFSKGHLARIIIRGEASSWPIARDLVNSWLQGHTQTSLGIYTAPFNSILSFIRDLGKDKAGMSPDAAGKTIRDFNFIFGLATGMTNEEAGKIGEYVIDHTYGKQKIKGPGDVYQGIRHGRPLR